MPRSLGKIRVGIGGWLYRPWRGVFYPKELPQARELAYASRHLTTIEINSTFYRTQSPATFRKWAKEVPDGFVFSVKAPRFTTHRRVLAESKESIGRFVRSGITELGDRLGPILWQFPPTKKFDEPDFASFLEILPERIDGQSLRHAVEVRHASFLTPSFIALLRRFNTPVVFTDHAAYPNMADIAGGFVYARLQHGNDRLPTAYPPAELDRWAEHARIWADGRESDDLPRIGSPADSAAPRDVFVYFIHEAKLRAPAAAMALLARIGSP